MLPLGDDRGLLICWFPLKNPLFWWKKDDNAGVCELRKLRKLWIERRSSRSSKFDLKARITRSCNIKFLVLSRFFKNIFFLFVFFCKVSCFFLLLVRFIMKISNVFVVYSRLLWLQKQSNMQSLKTLSSNGITIKIQHVKKNIKNWLLISAKNLSSVVRKYLLFASKYWGNSSMFSKTHSYEMREAFSSTFLYADDSIDRKFKHENIFDLQQQII